jgi:anaerobic selenocysteine-containing dehydrogenase
VSCNSCSGNTISLTTNGGAGSIVTFTATQGGTNVTSSANWSSSNQSVITTPSAGSATLGGLTGLVTITATTSGGSGSAQITVTP